MRSGMALPMLLLSCPPFLPGVTFTVILLFLGLGCIGISLLMAMGNTQLTSPGCIITSIRSNNITTRRHHLAVDKKIGRSPRPKQDSTEAISISIGLESSISRVYYICPAG